MTRETELEQTPDDEGSGDANAESNADSSESGDEDESKQENPPETEVPEKETSVEEVTPKEISSTGGESTPESKEGPVEKDKTSENTEETKTKEEKPDEQASENKTETTSELTETKPSEIADSSAQSGKQESSEKDGQIDSTEVPVNTTPPPLPEAGEEMPGQLPEPLTLEISKSEQKNQILSKGATVEEASDDLSDKLQRTKGKGQSLDDSTSREMGQQMGADFSDVRIHTDSEAGEMNKEIGAKAFTHGKDIYFNDGQYNTGSKEGKHLLAHELTHTVQQGAVSGKTPSIQRSWGAALGGLAKGAAIAGVKLAIRQLGEMAMGKIMEQITGVKGDQKEKAGDWKTRLMNMGQEMLTGEKQSNDQLNQSKAQAEKELQVKKGETDPNSASPDPLPAGIMELLQKILNFGSGQGGAFGTDKKTEEEAVESGVQQDGSDWSQMSSQLIGMTPLAGENEQDINNLISSTKQLKDSNWRSLNAWQKLFQSGKSIIPGLGGIMEK
ncbi:MAG: DUF4157 domain-containing protein, partial [Bacteroidetes bacterium]|nr:DUF4157 domain-containing protein [Bacteroidota bacterium]